MKKFRPSSSAATTLAAVALIVSVSGATGAVAATIVTGANIKDGTVRSVDIRDNNLKTADIRNGTLKSADVLDAGLRGVDILDGSLTGSDLATASITGADVKDGYLRGIDVRNGTLTGGDLAASTIGSREIATGGVGASEVGTNSIDSDEVRDFGLTNRDVGVLWAAVGADGSLIDSSGGVTVAKGSTGWFRVDFGRDNDACGYTASLGDGDGPGVPAGQIGVTDHQSADDLVQVLTMNSSGTHVNMPFQIIAAC